MIGSLPRVGPGDRISAEEWNRLVEQVERLSNLSASPPLSMRPDASGYHLRLDQQPSPGGTAAAFSGAYYETAGSQTIPTFTFLPTKLTGYTSANYDVTGYINGTNDGFVIPKSGYYHIILEATWAFNASGERYISIVNTNSGATYAEDSRMPVSVNPDPTVQSCSAMASLVAGTSTIAFFASQDSGGNQTITNSSIWIAYLGS